MHMFSAHVLILSYVNIFGDLVSTDAFFSEDTSKENSAENLSESGTRSAASVKEEMMKKFAVNCTGLARPEQCVYNLLGTTYSRGYQFTVEERHAIEADLKITECMDENDTPILGCDLGRHGTKQDVRFILWTSNSTVDNFNENHAFDGQNPTYFIFHGFFSMGTIDWIKQAKDGLLQTKSSANVISVDWAPLASVFSSGVIGSYCSAVESIQFVAERTSELILSLVRTRGLLPSNLHMIGHSLGAHAAGITSKLLQTMDNGLPAVAAITGLYPAGPLFFNRNSSQKLSREDAAYVQVIHTNGGTNTTVFKALLTGTFGYFPPLGDDDFYPNGGVDQPGCTHKWFCDHTRASDYWVESIESVAVSRGDASMNPAEEGISAAEPQVTEFTATTCDSYDQFK
ncbi:unnamed protein product, partial [Meganyctiphanes norvegica]